MCTEATAVGFEHRFHFRFAVGLATTPSLVIDCQALLLLAIRALLHTCRLVLDMLGIWILMKLDWSIECMFYNN
jgi:hypothetical protein